MKKLIIPILVICLMVMSVSAVVQYTGTPQPPYLIFGEVSWNDQLLLGARLELTNQNTGYTRLLTTDANGYWATQASNWLTNNANRPPIMFGDVINIVITDGCGTGDTCEQSFTAMSVGFEQSARVRFDISGDLSCPPVNCPSCSCGGSSGSYDCPATTCTQEDCEDTVCPETTNCSEPTTCPEEKVCEEPICPTIPPGTSPGEYITLIIGLALAGVGGAYFTKNKTMSKGVGIKTYLKRDGTTAVLHKHPGTTGYHDPIRSHTPEQEKHEKGQMFPKYEKDASGAWKYVG